MIAGRRLARLPPGDAGHAVPPHRLQVTASRLGAQAAHAEDGAAAGRSGGQSPALRKVRMRRPGLRNERARPIVPARLKEISA